MNKKIVLSTGNICEKYEVIGIVHIEAKIDDKKINGGWNNFRISEAYSNMSSHFIEAAKRLNGNGVINISYTNLTLPNFDFTVIGSGTVVKINANEN